MFDWTEATAARLTLAAFLCASSGCTSRAAPAAPSSPATAAPVNTGTIAPAPSAPERVEASPPPEPMSEEASAEIVEATRQAQALRALEEDESSDLFSGLLTPPADGQKTASGLVSTTFAKGYGKEHAAAGHSVEVKYAVWSGEGKLIASTYVTLGDRPSIVALAHAGPGLRELLQSMVVGESRRAWIRPANK